MQQGYLYKQSGNWAVRFREAGRSCSKTIAPAGTKKAEARELADAFMRGVNGCAGVPGAGATVHEYVALEYLPWAVTNLEPSTTAGYKRIWESYGYLIPERTRLRDWRTFDGERFMRQIAGRRELASKTFQHIKAFMSGVWTSAARLGIIAGANPWIAVSIPRGKETEDTYAYTPEEVRAMLGILSRASRVAVAISAFAGLRKSEIMGLRWEDYQDDELTVSRKVWNGIEGKTKSRASRAAVPVVPALAEILLGWVISARSVNGYMFENAVGKPMDLHNLAERVIKPELTVAGLTWHGWHAFRRGLATLLHTSGVPDITIQRILRHSNVSVTQQAYIKTIDTVVLNAMEKVTYEEAS